MPINKSFIGYAAAVPMPALREALTVLAKQAEDIPAVGPDRDLFGRKAAVVLVGPAFQDVHLSTRRSFGALDGGERGRQGLIIWKCHARPHHRLKVRVSFTVK